MDSSSQRKKRSERVKLDLCQGKEMKSSKKSSLFANNPTIPDIDEYVARRSSSPRIDRGRISFQKRDRSSERRDLRYQIFDGNHNRASAHRKPVVIRCRSSEETLPVSVSVSVSVDIMSETEISNQLFNQRSRESHSVDSHGSRCDCQISNWQR